MTPLQLWVSAKGPERSNCQIQDSAQQQQEQRDSTSQRDSDENVQVEKESWSSAIKSMVNSLRPSSTRSPTRRASLRHPTPPPSHLSSTTSSSHLLDAHEAAESASETDRSAKRVKLTLKGPRSPTLPADVGNTNPTITSPRPPVHLTLAEPHGPLLETTNGVRKTLNVHQDLLAAGTSPASTPDSASQRGTRKTSERRSLRSHDDGPRLKSELAVYFPNYEDIIYDAPREPELITTDTIIHISDEPYNSAQDPNTKPGLGPGSTRSHGASASPVKQTSSPSQKQKNKYNGAQVIDFSVVEKSVGHHPRDTLTDAFYFKSHRRAERKEKQLRNIEKERAMHEKAQLERLLAALEGHDWLRVMGIISVVDSDARKYEPKRRYFIDEVNALLQKFKTWKDEERRIRLEKEAALAGDGDDGDEEDESDGEPSSSDLDASAARQLQVEASGGAKGGKDNKAGKLKSKQRMTQQVPEPAPPPSAPPPPVYREPTPEGPFVSFYSKPQTRAAALGKSRHGRHLTAFGQPLPELDEQEFSLPDDYITPEALRDNARKRRRMKRESAVDAAK